MEGEGAGADRLLDALEGVVARLAEEDGADEGGEESAARTRAARAGDAAAMYESGGDDFSSDAQAMLTRVSATLDRTLGGAGARARAGAGLRAAPADSVAPTGGDVVVAAAAAEAAEALVSAMRLLDARPDPAGIPRACAPLGRSVDDSDAGERMRVLQQLRADYEVSTSTRPARVPTAPPSWAEVMYKVVAVTGGDDGGAAERYLSVYDGATEYRVGQTMLSSFGAAGAAGHSGGLYVSRTIAECIARDADGFPQDSALIGAPKRAVLRVLAWNVDRQRLPQRYGRKLAYEMIRPQEVLPYPETWRPGYHARASEPVPVRLTKLEAQDGVTLSRTQIRQQEAAAAQGGAQERRARLLATQAATVVLEEDVLRLERRHAAALIGANAPLPGWLA